MMTNVATFIALFCCLTLLTTEAIPLSVQGTVDHLARTNLDSTEEKNYHWNETSDAEDLDQIAGGSMVDRKDYQFMVLLTSNLGMMCGGTIISANPRIVLTAAHCLYGASRVSVSLFKGSYSNVDVNRYARIHPSYRNENAPMYDIALLYLPNQISAPYFGIIPPYLNGKFGVTYDSVGQSVFALGWGITSTGGSTSSSLKRADLNIKNTYYGKGYCQTIRNEVIQFCAGPTGTQLTGACRGDSGGPLIVPGYSQYILAGIVSYGGPTCGENSVYTRVSGFINWIDTKMDELKRSNM